MTANTARPKSNTRKVAPIRAVVVSHPTADKFVLLEAALDQSGVWDEIKKACRKAKVTPSQFPVLIKPDMSFFAPNSATGTDPQLQLYFNGYPNRVDFDPVPPYRIHYVAPPGRYYVRVIVVSGYNTHTSYVLRVEVEGTE